MRPQHLNANEYQNWLKDIKNRIRQTQVKAAIKVNTELLTFYWELGAAIVERQKSASWGSGFLKRLSLDLMAEFPDIKGFSLRNIKYIRQWYLFYNEFFSQIKEPDKTEKQTNSVKFLKGQQPVALLVQIPWGHNLVIISKCKDVTEALYYVNNTIEHNWSRNILTHQIESGLYHREGKAVTNFVDTLPSPQSDHAQ